jgi:hypothetical protein
LYCTNGEDIWHVFNDALHFFGMFFNNIHMWSAEDVKYEQGAWVRLYGVPFHAWNEVFFKLCVMDVGRFVRADACTVDKTRIDFARILISTTQLDIVNSSSDFIIDGGNYSIKLVEEWGWNLGEDAFLSEEEPDTRLEALHQSNNDNGLDEVQGEWELDDLVTDLHKEWSAHERKKGGEYFDLEDVDASHVDKDMINGTSTAAPVVTEKCKKQKQTYAAPVVTEICKKHKQQSAAPVVTETCKKQKQKSAAHVVMEPVLSLANIDATAPINSMQQDGNQAQTNQCVPWSLEWLPNVSKGAAAIASSSKILNGGEHMSEIIIAKDVSQELKQQEAKSHPKKFKHSAGFLKRVARMSSGDRKDVLKILKKHERYRKARKQSSNSKAATIPLSESSGNSNSSVNKDLESWVVLHEKKEVVKADVKEIGRAIGLTFNGDPHNSFNLLSKEGRRG